MLLVDDGEAKIIERNALVEQRVRSDDNIGSFIARNEWEKIFFLTAGGPKRNLDSERIKPAAQHGVMLLGQDLSWRHEGGLEAGFHCEQHRCDCHNSLAGTDIAL